MELFVEAQPLSRDLSFLGDYFLPRVQNFAHRNALDNKRHLPILGRLFSSKGPNCVGAQGCCHRVRSVQEVLNTLQSPTTFYYLWCLAPTFFCKFLVFSDSLLSLVLVFAIRL